ncbi:DUF4153 domain-containing protein [Lujinxingia vulgaris]|uniref:DUF4153 domain-containing protein n=1 Tax=Lujinxingia vulgaris TaxID=2600176 RepID=A0A5C6X023_9DELT|nr:DUF4153 domain-containing protein [Lujinxingia vulgaris]TXD34386.1 DUF4153 domain-containing protein [Lujinxingia vulgaris]
MQAMMVRFLQNFGAMARQAARRHPLEVAMGLGVAALLSGGVEQLWRDELVIAWTLTAVPALMWVFAVSYLHILKALKVGWRVALSVVGLGVWSGWAWTLSGEFVDAEIWRVGLASVGLVALLMVVGLAAQKSAVGARLRTWRAAYRLWLYGGMSALYLGALWVGLALAVYSVDTLFDLSVDGELYGHLAAWIFGPGFVWMLAARTEEIFDFEQEVGAEAQPWSHRLGFYLTLPLASVYLVITYAYAIRVLVVGEAPSNVLSPLILGAGVLMWMSLEQVEVMRRKGGYETLVRVVDALPVVVGPMVPLAIWAVFERIGQYGWTEFRYVRLLALATLLAICGVGAVGYIRRRPMGLWVVPVVVAAGTLVGALGPISAPAVAERSQVVRLQREISAQGVGDAQGAIDVDKVYANLSGGGREVAALAYYVHEHFGDDALAQFVPASLTPEERASWEKRLWEARWGSSEGEGLRVVSLSADQVAFEVIMAATLYPFSYVVYGEEGEPTLLTTTEGASLEVWAEGATLIVEGEQGRWRGDLSAHAAMARNYASSGELDGSMRRVVLVDEAGARRGEVVLDVLGVRVGAEDASVMIQRANGLLVVDR